MIDLLKPFTFSPDSVLCYIGSVFRATVLLYDEISLIIQDAVLCKLAARMFLYAF